MIRPQVDAFDRITLVLPTSEELQRIVEDAASADPAEVTRRLVFDVLRRFVPTPSTPERLVWFALWSQTRRATDASIIARENDDELSTRAARRAAFEIVWKLSAIVRPIASLVSEMDDPPEQSRSAAWDEVRQRLAATAAWMLYSDRRRLAHRLTDRYLDQVFELETRRNMSPLERELHEKFTGEQIPMYSDEENAVQRAAFVTTITDDLSLIDGFLENTRLRPWLAAIQAQRPQNLFDLLEPGHRRQNLLKYLEAQAMEFAYTEYSSDSDFLHSNTIHDVLTLRTDSVLLHQASDEELSKLAANTSWYVRFAAVKLLILNDQL